MQVDVRWVDSEDINDSNAAELLAGCAGIIVPGGFGNRGIEGMISAVCWARENQVPYLGICLGMQMAVVEFARHVAGLADAHSSELAATAHPVIDLMPDQQGITDKGGTMRLGAYPVISRRMTPEPIRPTVRRISPSATATAMSSTTTSVPC